MRAINDRLNLAMEKTVSVISCAVDTKINHKLLNRLISVPKARTLQLSRTLTNRLELCWVQALSKALFSKLVTIDQLAGNRLRILKANLLRVEFR